MMSLQEFQNNEVIIQENEIDEHLYLIKSGSVKVTKSIKNQDIEVAQLGTGLFFGEMALIDERPRTATVIAMEETVLKVFHRDNFLSLMQTDQDIAVKFLSGIFSRLRDANSKIDHSFNNIAKNKVKNNTITAINIQIQGITEKSIDTLPDNPSNLLINQSTFNIGRKSSDPFSNNNLELKDKKPLQISRNHFSLQLIDNKVAIYDTGSCLGLRLNNNRIGGVSGLNGPLFLASENSLILGTDASQLEYKVTIQDQ